MDTKEQPSEHQHIKTELKRLQDAFYFFKSAINRNVSLETLIKRIDELQNFEVKQLPNEPKLTSWDDVGDERWGGGATSIRKLKD